MDELDPPELAGIGEGVEQPVSDPVFPTPNERHLARLKSRPELAEDFDRKFGPGAAAKHLGIGTSTLAREITQDGTLDAIQRQAAVSEAANVMPDWAAGLRQAATKPQEPEAKPSPLFGDIGKLAPEERRAAAEAELQTARAVEPVARETAAASRATTGLIQDAAKAPANPRAPNALAGVASRVAEATTGLLSSYADDQKKRVEQAERMVSGDADLPEYGFWRDKLDGVLRTAIDTLISKPIQGGAEFATSVTNKAGLTDIDPIKNDVARFGKYIEEYAKAKFPEDKARQYEFSGKIAEGIGSSISLAGGGIGVRMLGGGEKGAMAAIALFGGLGNIPEEFEKATKAIESGTATEQDRFINMLANTALGATEVFGAPAAIMRGKSPLRQAGSRIAREAGEEGAQEAVQTAGGNIAAQQTFEPGRDPYQGVLEGVAVAGLTGGAFGAAMSRGSGRDEERERERQAALKAAQDAVRGEVEPGSTGSTEADGTELEPRPDFPASSAPTKRTPAEIAAAPAFNDVLAALPRDPNGDPDLEPLIARMEEFGVKGWNRLTPEQRSEVYRTFAPIVDAVATQAADPFAVPLLPTAQREGVEGIVKALSGMSATDALAALKQQVGLTVRPGASDAETLAAVGRAVFEALAQRSAAAGGEARTASYRAAAAEAARALSGKPKPTGEEIIAGLNQPMQLTDADRTKFDEVLGSKLARKDWAKATRLPEPAIKMLIDEAVKDGRLKMVRGQPRRTGKKAAAKGAKPPATAPRATDALASVSAIETLRKIANSVGATWNGRDDAQGLRNRIKYRLNAINEAEREPTLRRAMEDAGALAKPQPTNQQILDFAKQSGRLEIVTVGDRPKGTPQEPYWTYKAPPTPTVADLPPGTFSGTEKEFASLSPGMRREILRSSEAGRLGAVRPGADRLAAFREQLTTAGFKTIVEARKAAAAAGIKETGKALDELIEAQLVEIGRGIVQNAASPGDAYQQLVGLYNRQPNLGTRTSTSVANQAYSTPLPLAFLASRLADVAGSNVVYEPSAGNGALLIEANPSTQTVYANELDGRRAAALEAQGFRTSTTDATDPALAAKIKSMEPAGAVIMNPPFGAVREAGRSKTWTIGKWETSQVDHAIAFRGLEAMADNGRAVLIVGGIKASSVEERRKGYRGQAKREFYARLYGEYNVTDHFTVSGDLYRKQGAAWPVDVIVIEGRGKSARTLPAAAPPTIYDSWDALAEKLPDGQPRNTADGQASSADPGVGQPAGGDATGVEPADGGRPRQPQSGPADEPARIRSSRDRGESSAPRGLSVAPGVPEQPGQPGDAGAADQPAAPRQQRVKRPPKGGQAQYEPASQANSLDTLIPVNMASAASAAMQRISEKHGSVDALVADRLGYQPDELSQYFSAEQVDALAAAIDNVERGAAFIIGDQTGIGKGRIVAGMLRYAMKRGLVPVLVTEKPDLYGDMYRDMRDIGLPEMLGREPRMFMTNSGETVTLDEQALEWKQEADAARAAGEKVPAKRGKFLSGGTSARQMDDMRAILAGEDRYDVVFTTYDQMNTVKGQSTPRRDFLSRLGPRALIAFDESHNAGGAAKTGWESKNKPLNRADFARDLAKNANGVIFSSATYAKRPDVMDLYARTDMGKAVDDPKQLPELIQRGGVPMQQIVATMLSDAGQYLRRERSFDGLEYAIEPVPVDADTYRQFSEAIRAVFKFDLAVKDVREELMKDALDAKGMAQSKDTGVGEAAAHTTAFSSLMHNIVNQMLLAIKAKATAQRAIDAFRAGEKPVIALANTNESFIRDFASQEGIEIGDAINLDFGDVLRRYLSRTLRITIKQPDGDAEHVQIPVEDLPPHLREMYRDAELMINGGNYDGLPISPIDAVRSALGQAGMKVAEVTGRQTMIDYSAKTPKYVQRPRGEQGPSGKRSSIAALNAGRLDALILNRSGSTGVSMHASEKFKDQRRRRMILAQAEANIDTHLQMLGRVHRTGQVTAPAYSQIAAEIPAEARPTAVLMRKMASLNANTTGARGSVFMAESVDFMNEVGDKVVWEYLKENPEVEDELGGDILKTGDDGLPSWEDAAKRATGRLVLLSPEKQAEFLEAVQSAYQTTIEELDALGENPLEAKTLDLQARTIEETTLKDASGDGPFMAAAKIEKVSVKASGRAMSMDDIAADVAKSLKSDKPEGAAIDALRDLAARGREWSTERIVDLERRVESWMQSAFADMEGEAKEKAIERENAQLRRVTEALRLAFPGSRVSLTSQSGEEMNGIVLSIDRTGKAKSQTAPGTWTVAVAVPDSMRVMKLSLSKVFPPSMQMGPTDKGARLFRSDKSLADLAQDFDRARLEGRETRYVVTGNILAGFDQTNGKGRIVNFTAEDGTLRPGILMNRDFMVDRFMGERAIRFKTGEQVAQFVDRAEMAVVKDKDGNLAIGKRGGSYVIQTPAARATGGRYYTDPDVRDAIAPLEFVKMGNQMVARGLDRRQLVRAIDAIRATGALLETKTDQEIAQQIAAGSAQAAPGPPPSNLPSATEIVNQRKDRSYALGANGFSDDLEQEFAARAVAAGRRYDVPADVTAKMREAIKRLPNILPAKYQPSFLRAARPTDDGKVEVAFERLDGRIFTSIMGIDQFAHARAFTEPRTGSVAFFSFDLPANFENRLSVELWHEAIHALREVGALDGVFEDLVAHAHSLRILETTYRTFKRGLGDPQWQLYPQDTTSAEIYLREYAGSANLSEELDQEAVAHMTELLVAGVPLPLPENIRRIYADIETGRMARGETVPPVDATVEPDGTDGLLYRIGDYLWRTSIDNLADRLGAVPITKLRPWSKHRGPVLAFHGTTADFDKFDADTAMDVAHHFGTPDIANKFASGETFRGDASARQGRVIPVVLDIRNPVTLPDLGEWNPPSVVKALGEAGITVPKQLADVARIIGKRYDGRRGFNMLLREYLVSQGYDGIRYLNAVEGKGLTWSYIAIKEGTATSALHRDVMFAMGGRSIEQVWGPKWDIYIGQQYRVAEAGGDLSTMWDILTAKLSKASGIEPEMRAAMQQKLRELYDDMGPEGRAAAGIKELPPQAAIDDRMFAIGPTRTREQTHALAVHFDAVPVAEMGPASEHPGRVVVGGTPEQRKARAQRMGFDTSRVLYHGTLESFDAFHVDDSDINEISGTYLATSRLEANMYAGAPFGEPGVGQDGGRVLPLYSRTSKPAKLDVQSNKPIDPAQAEALNAIADEIAEGGNIATEALRNAGFDSVEYHQKGKHIWTVVFDPADLRSVNAGFDPSGFDNPNLMFAMAAPRVISADRVITLAGPTPTDPVALREAITATGVEVPDLPTVEAIRQHLSANGYGAIRHHDPATGWQYAVWEPANVMGAGLDLPALRQAMEERAERAAAMEAEDVFELATPAGVVTRDGTLHDAAPMFAFAGPRAKTAPLASLKMAQRMAARGRPAKDIHRATGWFQGHDKLWRFEIDDSTALMNDLDSISKPWTKRPKGAPTGKDLRIIDAVPLGDVLDHQALFAAYPFLRKMLVRVIYGDSLPNDLNETGKFSTIRDGNKLSMSVTVRGRSVIEVHRALLHELQHYIQTKEGWDAGASATNYTTGGGSSDRRSISDSGLFTLSPGEWQVLEHERVLDQFEHDKASGRSTMGLTEDDLLRSLNREAAKRMKIGIDGYARSPGEAEANLTMERGSLTADERRNAFPPQYMPRNLDAASPQQFRSWRRALDAAQDSLAVTKGHRKRHFAPVKVGEQTVMRRLEEANRVEDIILFDRLDDSGNPELTVSVKEYAYSGSAEWRGVDYRGRFDRGREFADLSPADREVFVREIEDALRQRNLRLTVSTESMTDAEAGWWWQRDPGAAETDPRFYVSDVEDALAAEHGDGVTLKMGNGYGEDWSFSVKGLFGGLKKIKTEEFGTVTQVPLYGDEIWDFINKAREARGEISRDRVASEFKGVDRAIIDSMRRDERGGLTMFAFAGPKAKTADLKALARAEKMDAAAPPIDDPAYEAHRTAIWNQTGWFRGTDRKWRFEIDDSAAAISPALKVGGQYSGSEAISNDGLFAAYPALRDLMVYPVKGVNSSYSSAGDINLGMNGDGLTGIMLHEMQHATQQIEGFARGGNKWMFSADEVAAERARLQAIQDARPPEDPNSWTISTDVNVADMADDAVAFSLYSRLAGEVEARTVERRRMMSAAERKAVPPWISADTDEDLQLVRFRGEDANADQSVDMSTGNEPVTPDLDMSPEARKARAEAMGFDTSRVWYHGTRSRKIDAFEIGRPSKRYVSFIERDVASQGVFLSPSEDDAKSYGPNVGAYYARTIKTLVPPTDIPVSSRDTASMERSREAWDDFLYIMEPEVRESGGKQYIDVDGGISTVPFDNVESWANVIDWNWLDNPEVVRRMKERGYDSAEVYEPNDESGKSLFVANPSNIRSVNAAFDPAKADSPNLMFAMGGNPGKWQRSDASIASAIENLKDATGMTVLQGLRGMTLTRGDTTARIIPGDGKNRGTTSDGRPRQRFGNTWIGARRIEAQYDNYSGVARMRSVRRLDETAHEAAHHLERIVGAPLLDLQTQHGAELDGMSAPGLADTRSEQWAEWFRLYITNQDAARLAAPNLYEAFEDMLDAEMPGMLGNLEAVQEMIANYNAQSPLDQVANDLVAARHRNIAQRAYGSYRDGTLAGDIAVALSNFYTATIDKLNPLWKVTSALLDIADRNGVRDANGKPISLLVADNPYKRFRAFAGSYKKGHNWLVKGIRDTDGSQVAPPLRDALIRVFGAGSESGLGSTGAAAAGMVAGGVVGGPVGAVVGGIMSSAIYGKASDTMRGTGWDAERYQKFNAYVMAQAALGRYAQYEEKQRQIADLNTGLADAARARPGFAEAYAKTKAMLERRQEAAVRIDTMLKDRRRSLGSSDTEVRRIAQRLDEKKDDVLAAQMARDQSLAGRRDADRKALEKRQQEAVREAEALQQEVDALEVQQAIVLSEIDQLQAATDAARGRLEGLDEAVRQLRAVRERELAGGIHRPPVLEVKDKLERTIEEAERLFPEFVDAARIFHEYAHGLLVMEYRAGFHTPEQFAALAANKDWYAPLMRDLSDIRDAKYSGSQMGAKWQKYQALKGSDRAVLNPVDIIIERSYALARKTAYDAGVKTLVDLVRRAGPGSGAIAEEVSREEVMADTQATFDRIAASAKALGLDDTEAAQIVHLMEHELSGSDIQKISAPTGKGPKPALQVPYWENGERKMLRINDPEFANEIFESLNGIGEEMNQYLVRFVAAPSRWLSFGVTAHPAFAIVNMMRDMMAAWMTTGATPLYTQAKGVAMELSTHKLFNSDAFRQWSPAWIQRKVGEWQEFVRAYHDAGGIRGGQFTATLGDVKDKGDWRGLRKDGFNIEFRRFWDAIELSETSTRLGVARMAYKRAKAFDPTISDTDAIADAVFTARDVMDFDRRGSRMGAFTRIVAFLNPNLQGIDKAIRAGSGQGDRGSVIKRKMQIVMKRDAGIQLSASEERELADAYKFWFRVMAFNAAVVAIYMLHAGDPEEDEITDRMKQSHSMIDVANIWHNLTTGKFGQMFGLEPAERKQENWKRAPLPFELATPAIVGIWALRTHADKDPESYARLWDSLYDLLAPPVIPQLWKVVGEPAANYSSFTGRQIVSSDLQKLDPNQRYEWFTSTIAKNIGSALNVAPIKVDYVMTNGLGYMGREIQRYGEWLLPGGRQRPGQDEDMLTKRVKADPYKSSNAMTEFYRQMKPDGGGGGPVGIIKGMIVHDGAQYVQAASGYKKILDEQNPIAAKEWLAQKPEEMRAYATLMGHFNTAAQNIHPINRLDKVVGVVNRMQREILNGELKEAIGARRRRNITLESVLKPTLQDEEVLVDILNRVKVTEARNTFIAIGHGRWGGPDQKQLPIDLVLDELKTANEKVYDELTKRIQMTKVPSLEGAARAWKAAKPELLREQENAIIPDYGFDGTPQIGTREDRRQRTPRVLAR